MDDPRRPQDGRGAPSDEVVEGPPPMPEDLRPASDAIADVPAADRWTAEASLPPAPELSIEGPLTREAATAILDRAAELMNAGDYRDAAIHYRRVVGFGDAAVTAAALLGLGQALYRLDEDEAAVSTWESILELPETPATYRAWREVAAARVREGDLSGAIGAYRQAERRAPAADKPEIASRLGWLAKETGNKGAARRYFARARGAGPAFPLPWVVVGITVVISFMAFSAGGGFLFELLALDKTAVADGEYWRLWTVTLLHGGIAHLFFNMYALYLAGPIVEQMYGSRLFLLLYLLSAAGGSVASFVFGAGNVAVGASGAIFGLVGVLLAASRVHHPVLDRQSRAFVGQLGTLILINLAFGFAIPQIDNAAHIGGLVAGMWLGFLLVPGRVPTLRSLWHGTAEGARSMVLPTLGVVALVVALVAGVIVGTEQRQPGTAAAPVGVADAPAVTTHSIAVGR